jgi:hypothetical protein
MTEAYKQVAAAPLRCIISARPRPYLRPTNLSVGLQNRFLLQYIRAIIEQFLRPLRVVGNTPVY